ncbi:hypothetical protein ABZ172_28750 [Streptomyces sp. NPDC006296]|uniref:hypothetical protein n=1 Tax=Streptomyces sp. NPDC006296 TaxID=3156746 RepID=UPI0033B33DDD
MIRHLFRRSGTQAGALDTEDRAAVRPAFRGCARPGPFCVSDHPLFTAPYTTDAFARPAATLQGGTA